MGCTSSCCVKGIHTHFLFVHNRTDNNVIFTSILYTNFGQNYPHTLAGVHTATDSVDLGASGNPHHRNVTGTYVGLLDVRPRQTDETTRINQIVVLLEVATLSISSFLWVILSGKGKIIVKVKVQVYSLISSLKTYQPTLQRQTKHVYTSIGSNNV